MNRGMSGGPMMIDFLAWSPISLGRWAGIQVRVHFLFLLFVSYKLTQVAFGADPGHRLVTTFAWLVLLLVVLLIHELGHLAMASRFGFEIDEIRLWPLGNMVGPTPAYRNHEPILVALAGVAANALMVVGSAIILGMLDARFVWNLFGNPGDSGAPYLNALHPPQLASTFRPAWWVGWFGYLNWVVLLANLIPALPFDGGRAFRSFMVSSPMAGSKDTLIAPWLARSCALILFIGGMIRLIGGQGTIEGKPVARGGSEEGLALIAIALLIECTVRAEARTMEDGGFFDDGVFGYDFSEGYTSLEGSTAKVRPYQESALKRWRRRRSELRRERRQARESAEERRMDQILEKVHREGRASLTDEEVQFLVRAGMKLRNRTKRDD